MATDQRKMKEGSLHFFEGLTQSRRHNARNGICRQLKGSSFCTFDFCSRVECSLRIQLTQFVSLLLNRKESYQKVKKKKELVLEGKEPNLCAL